MKNEIKIHETDFWAYEDVRMSGKTNMFDVKRVEALSGLKREKILEIMKNYAKYQKKYGR